MTFADRISAVIAAMVEVATHGTRGAADTLGPDHDLAAALSGAVDLAEVAPLLPLSGADHQHAAGLVRIVSGGQSTGPLADTDRVLACRVAARMASSAALLVALDAHAFAGMAGLLWRAAGRLCGMETGDAAIRQTRALAAWANYAQGETMDISGMDPGAVARAAEAAIYIAEARQSAPGMTDLMVSPEAIDDVLAGTRQRVTVDLSAHLAAADKRARDTARECVRLHTELDKARKEVAGWHALVQEASQALGAAGFHGDNIVKQARRAAGGQT